LNNTQANSNEVNFQSINLKQVTTLINQKTTTHINRNNSEYKGE